MAGLTTALAAEPSLTRCSRPRAARTISPTRRTVVSEFASLARTPIGATGWAAATGSYSVREGEPTLLTRLRRAVAAPSLTSPSTRRLTAGTQRTDWTALSRVQGGHHRRPADLGCRCLRGHPRLMPLTTDNLIASGQVLSPSGTSHTINHPSSTTEGTTVIVFLNAAPATTITPPAGWETDNTGVYRLSGVAAGVTSWTFTTSGSVQLAGTLVEVDGLALVDPVDAIRTNTGAVGNGGTVTGTATPLNAGSQCMAFAIGHGRQGHRDQHELVVRVDELVSSNCRTLTRRRIFPRRAWRGGSSTAPAPTPLP